LHTIVFFCYTGLVAFLSLRPLGDSGIQHFDKLMHLLVYYIFAVFGYRMLKAKRYYWLLCLGIIAYGGALEVAQSYFPGRVMSAYDMLANTLGVVIGALVVKRGLLRPRQH
jgi:VanZ family protein